jgi:hypothetical protein
MIYLTFLFVGFILHILRDYDRNRNSLSNKEYIKKNSLKIVGSFILSLCLYVIIKVDGDINGITSLTLGYSGSSFFKYLLEKNFPNARF